LSAVWKSFCCWGAAAFVNELAGAGGVGGGAVAGHRRGLAKLLLGRQRRRGARVPVRAREPER
jgi:hypothetical protein